MTRSVHTQRYAAFRRGLLEARKAAGLSQEALGKMLGRPQSFVSKYEAGERRLDVVEFLEVAEVLGIDPARFIAELLGVKGRRKKR